MTTYKFVLEKSKQCLGQSEAVMAILDLESLWKVRTLLEEPLEKIPGKSADFRECNKNMLIVIKYV